MRTTKQAERPTGPPQPDKRDPESVPIQIALTEIAERSLQSHEVGERARELSRLTAEIVKTSDAWREQRSAPSSAGCEP